MRSPRSPPSSRGPSQLIAGAVSRLDALAGVDPRLDALAERLRALLIESEDLAAELRRYGEEAQSGELVAGARRLSRRSKSAWR